MIKFEELYYITSYILIINFLNYKLMKTKLLHLLICTFVLCVMIPTNLVGQGVYDDIVPNQGGDLPQFPEMGQMAEGKIAGFAVTLIHTRVTYFNGKPFLSNEICLTLNRPEGDDATSYTLQNYNYETEDWDNTIVDNELIKFEGPFGRRYVRLIYSSKYRLKVNGGDKDAYTSNEIEVLIPKKPTYCGGHSIDYSMWITGVMQGQIGSGIEASAFVQKWDAEQEKFVDVKGTTFSDKIIYEWYRRDENTYEMTKIEGADSYLYVTTEDDAGYLIVSVIRGDDVDLSFRVEQETAIPIKYVNFCSFPYLSDDGMILNTYHKIDDFNKDLIRIVDTFNLDDNGDEAIIDIIEVEEIKPGQYKIKADLGFSGYDIETNNVHWRLAPSRGELGVPNSFGVYIEENLELKAQLVDGDDFIDSHAELLLKRIDGDFISYDSKESENGMLSFSTQTGNYLLKTESTSDYLSTYFPSKTMWNEALEIIQPMYNMEYDDTIFVIEVQKKPEALPNTANGIIKGTVFMEFTQEPAPLGMVRAVADYLSIPVYLYDKQLNTIIAFTETNQNGDYIFENVPAGKYDVLVDLPGYEMLSVNTVTLISDEDIVDNVNYDICEEGIKASINTKLDINFATQFTIYPNPVKDEIHILGAIDGSLATIYNLNGVLMHMSRIDKGSINVSDLKEGLYFIQIGERTNKFIKISN